MWRTLPSSSRLGILAHFFTFGVNLATSHLTFCFEVNWNNWIQLPFYFWTLSIRSHRTSLPEMMDQRVYSKSPPIPLLIKRDSSHFLFSIFIHSSLPLYFIWNTRQLVLPCLKLSCRMIILCIISHAALVLYWWDLFLLAVSELTRYNLWFTINFHD